MKRLPKGYDGAALTGKPLKAILQGQIEKIGGVYKEKGKLILDAWPEIIGEKFANMTQAVSFQKGVLQVNIMNSSLYSILSRYEKPVLLKKIKERFPHTPIVDINFRIG